MKTKKICLILAILLISFVIPVYAQTDGYEIAISSLKDTYDLGETAKFEVTITKEGHPANLEAIDAVFVFPSEGQYVYPKSVVDGKIIIEEVLDQELESQTLTVNVYRHNRKYIIDLLKQQKQSGEDTTAIKEYLKDVNWGTLWDWENPAESVSEYSDIYQQINDMVLEFEEPLAATSKAITVIIDKEPPVIMITGVDNNGLYNIDITPVIDVQDAHDFTSTISLNGAEYIPGTTVSTDGIYSLIVEAKDIYGNSSIATVSFEIDKTPPEIDIVSPTDGTITTDENITVSGTVSEDTDSVEVNGTLAILNSPNFEFNSISLVIGSNAITVFSR